MRQSLDEFQSYQNKGERNHSKSSNKFDKRSGTNPVTPSSHLRIDQVIKPKGMTSDMINFEKMRK